MKKLLILFSLVVALFGSLGATAVGYVLYDVFLGDYSQFSKERILEILSKESVVYFSDGETQVGSLFGSEHRQYVRINEVPKHYREAVIAAEDGSFYDHFGVDFVSSVRAAVVNVLFNRREGASTITQQTVKNLYGRPVTNLRAKYLEAINAFKLERMYSKDEILEFWMNQFHVTGNGRGIGVAAKYYFNKDVADLSLEESAFIAGSVKGPYLYDPFSKKSMEARDRAIKRAVDRKNYVLNRMLQLKLIEKEDYDRAFAARIPFAQGRFQFNQLSVIELIKGQLNRKNVLDALGVEKVDQIASMGLKITTTLSHSVQDEAQYAVRQNLSRLATVLQGFSLADEKSAIRTSQLVKHEFYVGRINQIDATRGAESIGVGFGLAQCLVPKDGVERMAKFMDHGRYKGVAASKAKLFEKLAIGSPVLISVRGELPSSNGDLPASSNGIPSAPDSDKTIAQQQGAASGDIVHNYLCDLETTPRVNGGAVVIDKGELIAVVGGFSPHEYNRAVFARRQPGSTFKTHTYYAALHLGWHALAPLINVRDAYEWQSQFYYPRPDHPPKTLTTTLVGAGSFSENLASVWLMAHLTKKLSPSQFMELLQSLEVVDGTEDETALAVKMRDKFNVGFGRTELAESVLESVVEDYLNEIEVVSDRELFVNLATMNAGGPRYDKEIDRLRRTKAGALPAKERTARINMLRNTLHRWNRLLVLLDRDLEQARAFSIGGQSAAWISLLPRFRLSKSGRLSYFGESDAFDPSAFSSLLPPLQWDVLDVQDLESRLTPFLAAGADSADLGADVWLDGYMPAGLVREIIQAFDGRLDEVAALPLRDRLHWNFDLRYSAGMLFSKNLVEETGIVSKVEWVPSFPLGTNDVSLAELAMSYQTLLTGETYQFFEEDAVNQLSLLRRIEDADGNLLWEAERSSRQVFDSFFSSSILSILRGTVTSGTGRIANSSILLDGGSTDAPKELQSARIRIPTFGKTGTTNDYTNATYVGFLPYPEGDGVTELDPENAATIAVYVGYDNNKPMRRPGVRIAGGTGALPAWIEIAKSLIRERGFADRIDWRAMVESKTSEVEFKYGAGPTLTVPQHSGVVIGAQGGSPDSQGTDQGDVVDLQVFHDDYAESSEGTMKVSLPGRVERGVFNPQTRVRYLSARGGVIVPREIPELNLKTGVDLDDDAGGVGAAGNGQEIGIGSGAAVEEDLSMLQDAEAVDESDQLVTPSATTDSAPMAPSPEDTAGYEFLIPPPPPGSGAVSPSEDAP
jgi:membrane peptidoglycan carboxypeptidase